MGEVWKATDATLGREVAIKILPAALASDPERLARFEREAKVLASLNHPNIAAIYGFHEADGVRFLAMELVPGEDLAERLNHGPVPLADALDAARQIAEALEAAHEQGIVHRDLKPANIKLTPDGKVKVLDFGLAKALDPAASSGAVRDAAMSPTITSLGTVAGVILGTAAYMSPEQARGRSVDKRADIWAFGCVLYEMLSGKRAFEGETISDTLAAVLAKEPDFTTLPSSVPGGVRSLLRKCLEKDARKRLRDIGDARIELEESARAEQSQLMEPLASSPGRIPPATGTRRGASPLTITALAVAAGAIGLAAWALARPAPVSARGPVVRLGIMRPGNGEFLGPGTFAIAPDGSAVALIVAMENGKQALWIRDLEDPSGRWIPDTEGATFPFWSPDARHVAFFAAGKLKRVPRSGGAVQTVCDAISGRGGAWSPSGIIVFAPSPFGPLSKIDAGGGVAEAATTLDASRHENSHRFPCFLPDGRHFLYAIQPEVQPNLMQVSLASIDDPRSRPLLLSGLGARYAEPGYVLFTRDQALVAQRMDPKTLTMNGPVVPLAERVQITGHVSGTPPVECAGDGTIIYDQIDDRPTELVWLGRDGRVIRTVMLQPGQLVVSALSHDGRRLAAVVSGREDVLWVLDLEHGTKVRLSPPDVRPNSPVWTPDDLSIVALVSDSHNLKLSSFDASTGVQQNLPLPGGRWTLPASVAPDGTIVLDELAAGGLYDIALLPKGASATRPYIATPAEENGGDVSRDGRFIAYCSNASGRVEVYADSFPEGRGAVRVSTGGAEAASWWRDDGREIYFISSGSKSMMVCDVRTTPAIEIGGPRALFDIPGDILGLLPAPHGDRFLLLRPAGPRRSTLVVVQSWPRQLDKQD